MVITKCLMKQIRERNDEALNEMFIEEPKTILRLHLLIQSGYISRKNTGIELTQRGIELFNKLL